MITVIAIVVSTTVIVQIIVVAMTAYRIGYNHGYRKAINFIAGSEQ